MAKQYSKEGDRTLNAIQKADNFNRWMYEQIRPFLKGDIVEIGSGVGTFSRLVAHDFPKSRIVVSDIDTDYVKALKEEFRDKKNISSFKIDLGDKEDFKQISHPVDTVFALNVLEHVKDDIGTMNEIYRLLKPGGRFIVLVPAHQWLYSPIDKAVGHHRRYNKRMMRKRIAKTPFVLKKMFYFNAPAIAGWIVNGLIFRRSEIDDGAMGLFNKLVPAFRIIEKYFLFRLVGISLIVILEKKADS